MKNGKRRNINALKELTELTKEQTILYPLATERALFRCIQEGKVVFCVNIKADKPTIQREVERLFEVKVVKVNTLIRPDGRKIAFVKLPDVKVATDLAVKLGLF